VAAHSSQTKTRDFLKWYSRLIRLLVVGLAGVSGLGVLLMMTVVCLDVILRQCGRPIPGSFDIVKLIGAVTITCALPYTTAVKGHVAIEYFFHKLGHRGRIVLDTFARLVGMALFSLLAWQSVISGTAMWRSGEVTPTIQLPTFWVLYVTAFACAVVVLVILHNLLHPGKEMIKP
jgi:TRAP-type C4-dicarboxylate transport system permease small subunit